MPIQNVAIPCDDGIQKTTLGNDVLLKLLELLKTQRQNLSGKNSGSILRLLSFSIVLASFDNSVAVSAAKVYGLVVQVTHPLSPCVVYNDAK